MSPALLNNSITWCDASAHRPINPVTGTLWYNTNTCESFLYNGSIWVLMGGSVSISDFKRKLTAEDVETLCEKHPGLRELQDELKEAQEKFDMYLALVNEEN